MALRTEREKMIVDALRCDGYCGSKCDACGYNEYKVNGGCYGRLLENDAADLIEQQSAEIDRISQENAKLRGQAYNLTLYLAVALSTFDDDEDRKCAFMCAMLDEFDGMPGYNPTILGA